MTRNLKIRRTLDGSDTLFVPELNEHYHSTFGAVQESKHVFIENGLMAVQAGSNPVSVFEVGFGTGLNVLLTLFTTMTRRQEVHYTAVELNPLGKETWERLNYPQVLGEPEAEEFYKRIHNVPWELPFRLNPYFTLTKLKADLLSFDPPGSAFDLIYFDAFAPDVQPELWTPEIVEKMFRLLRKKGILVTYSCKGSVKHNLLAAGFSIEKLPGPPGKREILRALKK